MQQQRHPLVGVVDDDAAVCDSLRFLLETAGHPVVIFHSAEDFFGAAGSHPLTCLLVDQHMPRVTGLDLLQRLHKDGLTFPVALMTGSPSPPLIRRAMELGATAVLEKPLSEAALFQFVDAATG